MAAYTNYAGKYHLQGQHWYKQAPGLQDLMIN